MLQINKYKKILLSNKKSGFAMLFAVLVSSILVAIGISMFNISIKELIVATSARDSEISYYAADSAKECVIYWDIVKGAFPTCLDAQCQNTSTSTASAPSIQCGPKTITFSPPVLSHLGGDINKPTYSESTLLNNPFSFSANIKTDPDSDISLSKTFFPNSPDPDYIFTSITTLGHNTGIPGRRVERGILFQYKF